MIRKIIKLLAGALLLGGTALMTILFVSGKLEMHSPMDGAMDCSVGLGCLIYAALGEDFRRGAAEKRLGWLGRSIYGIAGVLFLLYAWHRGRDAGWWRA